MLAFYVFPFSSLLACRFGDKAPEQEGFWSYVRKRPEGAILALLRHKQTGNIILAGLSCPLCQVSTNLAQHVHPVLHNTSRACSFHDGLGQTGPTVTTIR